MRFKYICKLHTSDEDTIARLTKQGMSIGLIDFALGADTAKSIKAAVLNVFHKLNNPIGLMLRLAPHNFENALEFAKNECFDFVITGMTEAADIYNKALCAGLKLILDVEPGAEASQIIDSIPYACGFYVESFNESYLPVFASIRKNRRLLYFRQDAKLPPEVLFDGFLAEHGDIGAPDIPGSTVRDKLGSWLLDCPQQSLLEITAYNTAVAAIQSDAAAVVAMTTDGGNIDSLSRFCLPMPLIAVAARPRYEKLLLSLIGNYGVLPTAITKIPEQQDAQITFAAFVSELYGYKKGDIIIVTGHYLAEMNPNYTEILVLN